MEQEQQPQASPHILIFPFPAQGHINSMLKLAELFALVGLEVTFLNTEHNHARLVCHTDIRPCFAKYPRFKLETIPNGLPQGHPLLGGDGLKEGHGLLLNTFEDLEGGTISHMRTKCPKIYSVGPLHEHLKTRIAETNGTLFDQSSNSLWEVDRTCLSWLDKQPKESVVYESFGQISCPKKAGDGEGIPAELVEGTKEIGYIVSWAPQEEVLAHWAVDGFLTHSGWNSTLESVVAGVPMICRPYFSDQQLNSRFVSEVWKLGLDMKDVCDRKIVEKMVNDLMVEKREEFVKSAPKLAKLAKVSVNVGGSSYSNLDSLIDDIRLMNKNHCK
ncbi:hypothetical protein REPUB_Repub13aG0089500 [Reevesia pubescens]